MKTQREIHFTDLTEMERWVLIEFMLDCFVSDHGWGSRNASTWTGCLGVAGMTGKQVSGVISSLSKKGLMICDEESESLTDAGRRVCDQLAQQESSTGLNRLRNAQGPEQGW